MSTVNQENHTLSLASFITGPVKDGVATIKKDQESKALEALNSTIKTIVGKAYPDIKLIGKMLAVRDITDLNTRFNVVLVITAACESNEASIHAQAEHGDVSSNPMFRNFPIDFSRITKLENLKLRLNSYSTPIAFALKALTLLCSALSFGVLPLILHLSSIQIDSVEFEKEEDVDVATAAFPQQQGQVGAVEEQEAGTQLITEDE